MVKAIKRSELYHSAKGTKWSDHKYIAIRNGRYIYPEDTSKRQLAYKLTNGVLGSIVNNIKERSLGILGYTIVNLLTRKKLAEKEKQLDALPEEEQFNRFGIEKTNDKFSYKDTKDLQSINTNYDPGSREYSENCARCAIAAELRQRGYDAVATPIDDKTDRNQNNSYDISSMFNLNADKDGSNEYITTPNSRIDVNNSVQRQTADWPDGARGFVYVSWKNGTAHIMNCIKEDGRTIVYDAQSSNVYDPKDFGESWSMKDLGFDDNAAVVALQRVDNTKADADRIIKSDMIAFDSSKREKGKVFRRMLATKRHINKNTRTLMRNIRKEQTEKGKKLADLTAALKYKDAIDYFNKNTRYTRKPTNYLVIRS